MLKLAESHVLSLEPYVPGKTIENDSKIISWSRLGSNENCLGPSASAMEAATRSLAKSHRYPIPMRILVINKICDHLKDFDVKPEHVALGNGTSELIVTLVRALLGFHEILLYGWPSFIMYRFAAQAQGRKSIAVPLQNNMLYDVDSIIRESLNRSKHMVKLIILANPNNPTGTYLTRQDLDRIVYEIPKDIILVIDEAYSEYVVKGDYPNGLNHALSRPRTIVLRTFSKVYGLAGLRLGYAVGDKNVINILCRVRDPFNVNCAAPYAAIAALDDSAHVRRSIQHNLHFKDKLAEGLREFGFFVYDGVGNFLMAKKSERMPCIKDLCDKLMLHGVILRPLDAYGLKDFVRISVGTQKEIAQLFESLNKVLLTGSRSHSSEVGS
jgi:histidinol-phosphate aminotransferase